MALTLVLGTLIGIILGLSGAGGGILAVPALVAGMGWSMQQAAPVALIAVAGSATLGALAGIRRGLVRYRAATLIAVAGFPATAIGLRLAHMLPQRILMTLFAAVMLLVAARLLLPTAGGETVCTEVRHQRHGYIDPRNGHFSWTWQTGALLGGIGALTGFMTGLLGVGGGFILVPLLRRFTNITPHSVVATSLMVIALIGMGGIASALMHGVTLPLPATLLFAVATAGGVVAGRVLIAHLAPTTVQRGFAIILLAVASGLLLKAVFLPG